MPDKTKSATEQEILDDAGVTTDEVVQVAVDAVETLLEENADVGVEEVAQTVVETVLSEVDSESTDTPTDEAQAADNYESEDFMAWLEMTGVSMESWDAMDEADKSLLFEAYNAIGKAMTDEEKDKETVASMTQKALRSKGTSSKAVQEFIRVNTIRVMIPDKAFASDAIRKGWNSERAKKLYDLRRKAKASQDKVKQTTIHKGSNMTNENMKDVYTSALARTFGVSEKGILSLYGRDKTRAEKAIASADKEYDGMTPSDIIRHVLGLQTSYKRLTPQDVKKAFASTGFSTVDAISIFNTVHQRYLDEQYELQESIASRIVKEMTVDDFSTAEISKMILSSGLREVPVSGEVPHGTMTMEKFNVQPKRYAEKFVIDEMYYINDNIGMVQDALGTIANGAYVFYDETVMGKVRELMNGGVGNNGQAFFSTANGNLSTGAPGSTLGFDGYNAATMLFMNQRRNGQLINVQPANVIVPPALAATAMLLFQSTDTNYADRSGTANIWQGRFNPIVTAGLGSKAPAPTVTDTAWLMIADPARMPFLYVAKQRNYASPTLETEQASLDYFGTITRVTMSLGIVAGNPAGAVLSKGQ
jgi:hypothetical protein